MKNTGRHHINQMIKINISSNTTTERHALLDVIQCDRIGMTCAWLRPKMKNLNHHGQISNKSKLRDILQSNLLLFFKNVKVMRDQEKINEKWSCCYVSRVKGVQELSGPFLQIAHEFKWSQNKKLLDFA